MTISFVIPAYNEEANIGGCIESILREINTVPGNHVEIIVVDNASSDHTGTVAASYPGVTVVREEKKGISSARQAGFLASTGSIIANIDADNRLPAGWLKQAIHAFDSSPALVALSGPCIYYDLKTYERLLVRLYYTLGWIIYILNRFIFRIGSMVQGGNTVIRRTALEAINGFDEQFTFYGEDADIARRLRKIGPVRFSLNFSILSSGRRLRKEGLLKTAARYTANYFSTLVMKKAITDSATDIRDQS